MSKPCDTLYAIKYNLIFSDEKWAKFHNLVQEITGESKSMPELLQIYNKLPEWAQVDARTGLSETTRYQLGKLFEDIPAHAPDTVMVNDDPKVVPFARKNEGRGGR